MWPSGGRRRTHCPPPGWLSRQVRLERPPASRRAVSSAPGSNPGSTPGRYRVSASMSRPGTGSAMLTGPVAQQVLLDLAGRGLGQGFEVDPVRSLEVRQPAPDERNELGLG